MTLCDFVSIYTHQGAEVPVTVEVQIIMTAQCNSVYSHLYADDIHMGLNSSSSIATLHKVYTTWSNI